MASTMMWSIYSNYTIVPSFDCDAESDDTLSRIAFKWSQQLFNNRCTKIYDFAICITLSIDWIIDILTLFTLFQLENISYIILSSLIIIICFILTVKIATSDGYSRSNFQLLFPP
eukprot:788764_1